MVQDRRAGAAPGAAGHGRPAPPRDVAGIHFVPNDGRRFPFCGSWRSNWNHTGDPERATCPQCRVRMAAPPAP
jgi:hypothetical protein